MPDTTDPAASALDRISAELRAFGASDEDMRRLLKAVEAALKLADDWDAKAKKIGGQIALEDCDGATAGFKMIGYQNHRDHAAALREVITAALAGTQLSEDP